MRIFIGIKLEQKVHEVIESFLKPFKNLSTPIRWVKTKNIHLTLKFMGEVPDNRCSQMEEGLNSTAYTGGDIDIDLKGCGTFGRRGGLNIFWLGVKANPRLEQLFVSIEEVLYALGYAKENREFKPHITVGRNKKSFNFKSLFRLMDDYREEPITGFTATGFQVFKSDLKPAGPVYTILKEIPLTNA